jgi:glycosyltransferase involved in cell wall biosynthesis
MQKPLRILIVVDLAWDARLGAVRVFMALANAWREAGHTVSQYCFTDAFPIPTKSRFRSACRQLLFPWKAAAFIRQHADDFDVIDSLLGTLPFPKTRLRFSGLVVARSVGFYRLYEQFERLSLQRWPDRPRGKLLGRVFYTFMNKRLFRSSDDALRCCDLLNLPNADELRSVREDVGSNKPAVIIPYGLSAKQRRELRDAANPFDMRRAKKKISFIGMWSRRKGAKDWGKIIQRVRASVPDARFIFLGTLVEDRQVLRDIASPTSDFIELIAEYQPDELPALLADTVAGAFPSYAEGFGLAVLEQLAAGIPTVAYDAPGPRAILGTDLSELLVPLGDVEAFAARLVHLLNCDAAHYEQLSNLSLETAERFTWSDIAERTVDEYRLHLGRIRRNRIPSQ